MNLEIRNLISPDLKEGEFPHDPTNFRISISATIGAKNQPGQTVYYFIAASPSGLAEVVVNNEFFLLRGYILMQEFDWKVIYRAVENVLNHSRHFKSWQEIDEHFKQYAWPDGEY